MTDASVNDISDTELLRRAVRSALSSNCRKHEKHPRWVAVMDVFDLGPNYAFELCQRFGLDPEEEVKR